MNTFFCVLPRLTLFVAFSFSLMLDRNVHPYVTSYDDFYHDCQHLTQTTPWDTQFIGGKAQSVVRNGSNELIMPPFRDHQGSSFSSVPGEGSLTKQLLGCKIWSTDFCSRLARDVLNS